MVFACTCFLQLVPSVHSITQNTLWLSNVVPLGMNLDWSSEHQYSLLGTPRNCFKSFVPGGARPVQGTQGQSLSPLFFPFRFFWPPFPIMAMPLHVIEWNLCMCVAGGGGAGGRYRTEPRVMFGWQEAYESCIYTVVSSSGWAQKLSRELFRGMAPVGPCLQRFCVIARAMRATEEEFSKWKRRWIGGEGRSSQAGV